MSNPAPLPVDALAQIRATILDGETLIDYVEIARRMAVSVPTARSMVAARLLTPAIARGNVVRFHWPSVVVELTKGAL